MADCSEIKEIMENLGDDLRILGFGGPEEEMQQGLLGKAINHASRPDDWNRIGAYLKALHETCKKATPQRPQHAKARALLEKAFRDIKRAIDE